MEIILRSDQLPMILSMVGIFISLSLLAWLRNTWTKYLDDIWIAMVSEKSSQKMWNEKSSLSHRSFLLHSFILFINLNVLIFEYLQYNSVSLTGNLIFDFLLVFAGVMLFFVLKYFLYIFVGLSFSEIEVSRVYIHNFMVILRGYGLAIFPLIIIIPFVDTQVAGVLFLIGFILFLVSQILLFARAYTISRKTKFSILYLFLYLCALEIIPVLFVVKISGLFF